MSEPLKSIVEAILLVAGEPVNLERLSKCFPETECPSNDDLLQALELLRNDYDERCMTLIETASGYRIQVKQEFASFISRLWEERPPRYSRAFLETLALIAYRQPVTRAQVEEVRGVAVSSSIIKTLMDRNWIRVVGYREVPGKPALFATTKQFLDDFNLKSLDELPTLKELSDLDKIDTEMRLSLGLVEKPDEQEIAVVDEERLEEEVA